MWLGIIAVALGASDDPACFPTLTTDRCFTEPRRAFPIHDAPWTARVNSGSDLQALCTERSLQFGYLSETRPHCYLVAPLKGSRPETRPSGTWLPRSLRAVLPLEGGLAAGHIVGAWFSQSLDPSISPHMAIAMFIEKYGTQGAVPCDGRFDSEWSSCADGFVTLIHRSRASNERYQIDYRITQDSRHYDVRVRAEWEVAATDLRTIITIEATDRTYSLLEYERARTGL